MAEGGTKVEEAAAMVEGEEVKTVYSSIVVILICLPRFHSLSLSLSLPSSLSSRQNFMLMKFTFSSSFFDCLTVQGMVVIHEAVEAATLTEEVEEDIKVEEEVTEGKEVEEDIKEVEVDIKEVEEEVIKEVEEDTKEVEEEVIKEVEEDIKEVEEDIKEVEEEVIKVEAAVVTKCRSIPPHKQFTNRFFLLFYFCFFLELYRCEFFGLLRNTVIN